VLELAEKHNAVIACANYRMMPESSSVEVLTDIDDWWKWLHSSDSANLLSALPTPIELDLDRIITTGESAGGLLSVYLALTYPDEIRAATAGYPMFNQDGPVVTDQAPAPASIPEIPEATLLNVQKIVSAGNLVSSDQSNSRLALQYSIMGASALFFKSYARDSSTSPIHRDRLYQLQRLDQPDTKLPRGGLVILHGAQDPVVPANLSERFVNVAREKLRGKQGADNIVLSIQEGVHGFDNPFGIEEPWLKAALETAVSRWLE
jgi:acetyl esterase/lipase